MEDFYFNETLYFDYDDYYDFIFYANYIQSIFIIYVVTCIIICIGLPLTLLAIYALYSLVRKDNVAPIYVINLLISDLIQLCCMISFVSQHRDQNADPIGSRIYGCSLMASVYFMVCIALERYLVIAWPLWYRFRRTMKISVVVCVLVWVVPLFYFFFSLVWRRRAFLTPLYIFFLLSLPLLIFFLGGTLKALSASVSVPADRKRRIVAMLVLVLVIYLLLFLPIINTLRKIQTKDTYYTTLDILSNVLVKLSPLADLVLYVFMRKGAIDKVLASVCCCRMDSNDVSSSAVL
ncbi:ovarian cancer G-protein coupled receptor 1-like [Etheostoma cragini]|uniref:ovarian cancer G-protein coupled receptor 1-like n=1 Tax=Etheostoma cragini TaxID=417921 RepID=UPI00155E0678|nr:ovarian cancer G-protein coupled receptor 1-like [Etheostoma cragini]